MEPKGAHLFIDTSRVPAGVQTVLEAQGVTLHPYGNIRDFLAAAETPMALLYEPAGTSWTLLRALRQNRAVMLSAGKDPIQLLKAVKDETEMAGQKEAHRRDGAAPPHGNRGRLDGICSIQLFDEPENGAEGLPGRKL